MAKRGGSQWGVAGVNGVVGVVLLMLVAFLALVVNPPAPPGVAAFAPQANKPITKAPLNQSSTNGDGDGACAGGQACDLVSQTTTTLKTKPRGVPSSLQCFKWPDGSITQTFDPQSPPCIASWDDSKGNGGATSPGVTATEIRVALPVNSTGATWPDLKPILDFFNTRFQLYGRKITIVPFTSKQASDQFTGKFNQPESQRADAAQITQLKVFATHDFIDPLHYSWSLPVFRDFLTKNKIISIHGGEMVPYGTEADLVAHKPYEWTYYAPMDALMKNVATMACRQLVGKKATHAGEPELREKTRKFAFLLQADDGLGGPMPGLSTLQEGFASCGQTPRVVRFSYKERNQPVTTSAALREMENDGVTTVVWFPQGGGGTPTHPWTSADTIGYHPEWIVLGWSNYQTAYELNNSTGQTASAFGVGVWNKMPALNLEMWSRAFSAAGGDPAVITAGNLPDGRAFYQELMLLASGIQMAGPNLTPQSFARGLESTKFPNPGAAGPPFFQGHVGFNDGDTTMVDDMTQFWMDTRTPGASVSQEPNSNTSRVFCYVAYGRRFALDLWPTTDGFYAPNVCR